MKKMYSYFSLLIILISSCNSDPIEPKLVLEYDKGGVEVKVWKMKRDIHDGMSTGIGPHSINATGPLDYVLTKLHNPKTADLDITELRKTKTGYKVSIKTVDDINVLDIVNDATAMWAEAMDLKVYYETISKDTEFIKVANLDLLNSNIYKPENGISNRVETRKELYKIQGPIQSLIDVLLKEEPIEKIEFDNSEIPKRSIFSFELNRSNGIEGIKTQLKENYGLLLYSEPKDTKVLKVK